jgi:hypothetical protein
MANGRLHSYVGLSVISEQHAETIETNVACLQERVTKGAPVKKAPWEK